MTLKFATKKKSAEQSTVATKPKTAPKAKAAKKVDISTAARVDAVDNLIVADVALKEAKDEVKIRETKFKAARKALLDIVSSEMVEPKDSYAFDGTDRAVQFGKETERTNIADIVGVFNALAEIDEELPFKCISFNMTEIRKYLSEHELNKFSEKEFQGAESRRLKCGIAKTPLED